MSTNISTVLTFTKVPFYLKLILAEEFIINRKKMIEMCKWFLIIL